MSEYREDLSSLKAPIDQMFSSFSLDSFMSGNLSFDYQTSNVNLPNAMRTVLSPNMSHLEALNCMKTFRQRQEAQIAQHLQRGKRIDFLNEIAQVNPDIVKMMGECNDTTEAINMIVKKSDEKMKKLKKASKKGTVSKSSSKQISVNNFEKGNFESTNNCMDETNRNKTLKRSYLEFTLEPENGITEGAWRCLSPKANKVVVKSKFKRYVFEFDKIENLMDHTLFEGDIEVGNTNDILKEIDNFEFDNTCITKFLNFA